MLVTPPQLPPQFRAPRRLIAPILLRDGARAAQIPAHRREQNPPAASRGDLLALDQRPRQAAHKRPVVAQKLLGSGFQFRAIQAGEQRVIAGRLIVGVIRG